MFFKLTLLVILLISFYLILELSIKKNMNINKKKSNIEHFDSLNSKMKKYKSYDNAIQNFIAYPDKQPFCPNLYSSKARYWSLLPQPLCKGLHVKYCCTGCYYKICKVISCTKNKNGLYKVCKLTNKDIDNLKVYYDKTNESRNNKKKLEFKFNESKLNKLIGKKVLKYKHNNVYYPIQVLKYKKDIDRFDVIIDKVTNKKYSCKKIIN
jgi:hypothetical protein